MIVNDSETHFLEKTKDLLNESIENLDSLTKLRLERIRLKALSAFKEKPSRFFLPLRWIVFGSLATSTIATVALFFFLNTSPGDFPARHIEDFEIITFQERIDFHQDLNFYRWLAAQNGLTKGRGVQPLAITRQSNDVLNFRD
jgi:hypothetical protein